MTDFNPRLLVHTPAELATSYLKWAESITDDPGITWGVPSIDRLVIPMRAGDFISIIGRPGHGKSAMLAYFAKLEATRIIKRRAEDKEAVVFVTWESSAEELENQFQADGNVSASDVAWGRADLDAIRRKVVKRATIPIWVIGHGVGRVGQAIPRMTPSLVMAAIESMEQDFGVKPTLMLFDYLQLIPVEHARDRFQQVTEVPFKLKELAFRVGAPALAGVQARREVDDRKAKIPGMRDAQWASSIEQTADKVFSIWLPYRTEEPGQDIELGDRKFEINNTLMVLSLLKQRGEKGKHRWALHFDPARLQLAALSVESE